MFVRAAGRFPQAVPRLAELAVVLAAGGPTLVAAAVRGTEHDELAPALVAAVLIIAPLAVRHRWPLPALVVIVATALVCPVALPFTLPMMVALYTIAASRGWPTTLSAVAGVIAAAVLAALVSGDGLAAGHLVGLAVLCVIASGAGLYVGDKRFGMRVLRERADRLDRERELMAARAVAQERMRIAQELHDVIGHNVTVIVVQAQALGSTTADRHVLAATDGIAELGRATMVEMQRTLRLLREESGEATSLAPQPGLDSLDGLLARSRAAGLDVELAIQGTPRRLDQSVDTSAFRIIQEALTNVIKHAGGARTYVTLAYGSRMLDLSIVDEGQARHKRAGITTSGGHGLAGMRERATLFDGTFAAGLRAGRGFEVRVSLPYSEPLT